MSVVRWDPSTELTDLRRTVRRLFDDLRMDTTGPNAFAVDIYELPEELLVQAELPGVALEDVQVQIQGGHLLMRANRGDSAPEGARPLQREVLTGEFVRAFSLGTPIKAEAVSAEYKNGILTVHLPKADEAKARTITVRGS